MATRGQTHAKRARELAQQEERRERKPAKKAESATQRAGKTPAVQGSRTPDTEGHVQTAASERSR